MSSAPKKRTDDGERPFDPEAVQDSLNLIVAKIDAMDRRQKADTADLKADTTGLKADMAEVKVRLDVMEERRQEDNVRHEARHNELKAVMDENFTELNRKFDLLLDKLG